MYLWYQYRDQGIKHIHYLQKFSCVVLFFFSKKIEHEIYSQHILKYIISFFKYRYYIVQVSKIYSSYITETLHSLENNSPFPSLPAPRNNHSTLFLWIWLFLIARMKEFYMIAHIKELCKEKKKNCVVFVPQLASLLIS